MILFFGTRSKKLAAFQIRNVQCSYCQNSEPHYIDVYGTFAHLFWIPVFPISKKVFSECSHCKKTMREEEFSSALQQAYDREKQRLKPAVWLWSKL